MDPFSLSETLFSKETQKVNPTVFAFKKLLRGLGTDIDDAIISRIQQSNPFALITASNEYEAHTWYNHFKNLPNTLTRGIFARETGFVLNGRHNTISSVIRACRNLGDESHDFIFKLFPREESMRGGILLLPEVTAALAMLSGPFLVRCRFEVVCHVEELAKGEGERGRAGGPGETGTRQVHACGGLLMHMFSKSVSGIYAQLSETTLLKRTIAMIKAVNYVHVLDYVHMDVKDTNIFVSSNGTWFLDDFGSCVAVGTNFGDNTTTYFHFDDLPAFDLCLAEYRYDWQMLSVVIASQLNIGEALEHSNLRQSVLARIDTCKEPTLRDILHDLINCRDRVYEVSGMNDLCPDVIDPEF